MSLLKETPEPIIRVFAAKTKWTPTDELAFYDEPPMFDLPDLPVRVSVTFTWDIARGQRLYEAWRRRCKDVRIGGPAFDDRGGAFVPNRFVSHGVTITSRGCPKQCPWCFVPKREGSIRELRIQPGWVVQDNNLLACSRPHIEAVFDMLRRRPMAASFCGGLDLDYLQDWHIDLLKSIRTADIWVAFDTEASLNKLKFADDMLADFSIDQRRAYVLIGYRGDTIASAQNRCERVYSAGFLPFAMLYQGAGGADAEQRRKWHDFRWFWSRPAAYRSNGLPVAEQQAGQKGLFE